MCALPGGGLERAPEVVAREVADRTGASYYAVVQPDGCRHHLPSTRFTTGTSERLDAFLKDARKAVTTAFDHREEYTAATASGRLARLRAEAEGARNSVAAAARPR